MIETNADATKVVEAMTPVFASVRHLARVLFSTVPAGIAALVVLREKHGVADIRLLNTDAANPRVRNFGVWWTK